MENKVLIYLDFDGVLTTKFSTHSKYHIGLQFDSMCVNNLKRILKELRNNFEKVVIVVISDWRYDMSNEQLEKMLFDVYGLYTYVDYIDFINKKGNRERGIHEHLSSYLEVVKFFILDDMNYKDKVLSNYLIKTRAEDGIRAYEDVIDCIKEKLYKD